MKIKIWLSLICLSAAVLLYVSGFRQMGELSGKNQTSSLYFAEPSLSWDMIKSALEQEENPESLHVLLWEEEGAQTVESSSLSHRTEASVCLLAGDALTCLPEFLVRGSSLQAEDENGCILSSKTAQDLFGSIDIVGKEVSVREKKYQIRGITQSGGKLVYFYGSKEQKYSNMEFRAGDESTDTAQNFISRYGLPTPVKTEDSGSLGKLLVTAGKIPLLLVWLFFCFRSYRLIVPKEEGGGDKGSGVIRLGAKVCLTVLVICGIYWCVSGLTLPEDWIPTRWSDFGFYTEKLQSAGEAAKLFADRKTCIVIEERSELVQSCLLYFAGAAIAGMAALRGLRKAR